MKVLERVGRIAVARPNWSNGVRVDYEFKTSIFQSRNNTEKREAMRQRARVSIQFLASMRAAGIQRFMRDLGQDPTGLFFLPTRWRSTFSTLGSLLGDDFLVVSAGTQPFWLVVGSHLVVTDEITEEAYTVTAIVGDVITIDGTLTKDYAAGSRIMQAQKARLPDVSQISADLYNFGQSNVRYDVDPGSDPQTLPAWSPAMFEGREVFLTKPNWREAPRVDYDALRDLVDSGRGVISVTSPALDTSRVIQAGWSALDATEVERLTAFFLRMKGQRTGFYMPSWQEDITVNTVAASSSTTLLVDGTEFHDAYSGSTVYNVLIAFYENGAYQVNRIASTGLVGFDSNLTMTDPWTQEVNDTTNVMFCHHMRHASDSLSVQWLTNTIAEMQFTMRSVQAGEND